jgi:hypothetical protein
MFLFFESAMRGGISAINNRYARANNPYLQPEDNDSSQPHLYIYYLDPNNLYGWANESVFTRWMFSIPVRGGNTTNRFCERSRRLRYRVRRGMRSRIFQRTTRIPQRLFSRASTHDNNGSHAVSVLQVHEFETCVPRKTYLKPADQDQIQDSISKF